MFEPFRVLGKSKRVKVMFSAFCEGQKPDSTDQRVVPVRTITLIFFPLIVFSFFREVKFITRNPTVN